MFSTLVCRSIWHGFLSLLLLAATVASTMVSVPASARPSAMKLFPQDTLVFVRMANAREFGERINESASARMLRDPQLQPFVEQLYERAGKLYKEQAEQWFGIAWEDLKQMPQGEVAFAMVALPGNRPGFLLLVDQGGVASVAESLLERALDYAEEQGSDFSAETIEGVEVTIVRDGDNQDRMIGLFEREDTLVLATDAEILRNVLAHWDDEGETSTVSATSDIAADATDGDFTPGRTLAENHKFSTLVRHCRRPQDPPPQLIVFVDPLGLVQQLGRDNPGMGFVNVTIKNLGLDGVLGLGGALTFAAGSYDDLSHGHILLENPRAGILQLINFEPGDTTPQPWVPHSIENYFTWRSQFDVTYDRLTQLIDQLFGEGTLERQVTRRLSEPLGIDFRTKIIDNLAGRVTWVQAYEKPTHFRSQQNILAFELIDETAAQETLQEVMKQFPDMFRKQSFGSVEYYAIMPEWLENLAEEDRPFKPFVAIMDGHIFIGGSYLNFEQMVAARDGTIDRLVDSDDYARIVATLSRETVDVKPAAFMMNRAEESLRHLYELLTSDRTREFMEQRVDGNPVFAALLELLEEHQLPPFDVLAPYFAPGGGIMYDTDSGWHFISFTLRSEAAP